MRQHITRLTVLALFTISFSCSYEPEGLNFTNVAEPTTAGMDVNLNTANDTVYLFTKTTFAFSAELGNRKLGSITAYLGDEFLFWSTQPANTFTLDPKDYEPGTYTIVVKTSATSGTGSLADKADEETVQLAQQWTLIVDKTAPAKVNLTEIYPAEGTLWIGWEKYEQKNFQTYIVQKYCFIENYGYSSCASYTITDQNQLRVADASFLGGKVKYELQVKASDQLSEISSKEFTYTFDSELEWTITGENTINFKWRQTPFYANFKAYDFRPSFTSSADFYSENIKDTTYSFTPYYNVFSMSASYTLTIVSKGADRRTDHKSSTTYYNGNKFHPFTSIQFNEATNRYYLMNGYPGKDTLYQVNAVTGLIENKRYMYGYSFAVSPDGQLLYIAREGTIQRLDPNTFNVTSEYDLKALLNENYISGLLHGVSNDGVLILDKGSALVLDMNTFSVMKDVAMAYYQRITALSPDGSRFYIDGTEYTRQGNTYVKGPEIIADNNLWKIRFVNADTALALTTSAITIFNPATRAVLSKQTLSGYNDWIDYDATQGIVYVYDATTAPDEALKLYNVRRNSQSTMKIYRPYYNAYRLLNGQLLCASGYYIDLP